MITYSEVKNYKSKKRYKNYKSLNTMLETIDAIVIIGATSTAITFSISVVGLILLQTSAGVACSLSFGNKLIHEIILKKSIINTKNNIKKSTNNQIF